MVEEITVNEVLENNYQIIDTRSEIEFAKDHIPKAINVPILNTSERHEIGVLYAKDKECAIKKGFSIYHDKIDHLKLQLRRFSKDLPVVVYCFRGGMRSNTFAKLVESLGFKTKRIKGGYKEYRAFIQEFFQTYKPMCKFIVLHGLAGSGKTDLLQMLQSIDLEGLAQHRSSLFGSIGLIPNSQKMFESLLYKKLQEIKELIIFIEGESKKLGHVYIPDSVFDVIESAIPIKITSPVDYRVKRIVRDYFSHDDEKIKEIITTLKQYLGKETTQQLIEQINSKKYQEVAKTLLEDYYDSKYEHLINKIQFEKRFEHINTDKTAKELEKFAKSLLKLAHIKSSV